MNLSMRSRGLSWNTAVLAAVGMLLGSVSQHCVHRAACPVVVVRAPAE